MAIGRVKWFSAKKGYGFIEVDGRPQEIFVHYSDVRLPGPQPLIAGATVEFDLEPGHLSGDRARRVEASPPT